MIYFLLVTFVLFFGSEATSLLNSKEIKDNGKTDNDKQATDSD